MAFAVLAVRVSDTHLHLCFDGHEPPASVHFADASLHHDAHHEGEGHADKDVNLFHAAFVKKSGVDSDDLPLLAVVAILGLLIPAFLAPQSFGSPQIRAAGPRFYLRPPLRGPPLKTS